MRGRAGLAVRQFSFFYYSHLICFIDVFNKRFAISASIFSKLLLKCYNFDIFYVLAATIALLEFDDIFVFCGR